MVTRSGKAIARRLPVGHRPQPSIEFKRARGCDERAHATNHKKIDNHEPNILKSYSYQPRTAAHHVRAKCLASGCYECTAAAPCQTLESTIANIPYQFYVSDDETPQRVPRFATGRVYSYSYFFGCQKYAISSLVSSTNVSWRSCILQARAPQLGKKYALRVLRSQTCKTSAEGRRCPACDLFIQYVEQPYQGTTAPTVVSPPLLEEKDPMILFFWTRAGC